MKQRLKKMLTSILWIAGCVVLVLLLFQSWLIYHPRGYSAEMIRDSNVDPLSYTTSQGKQVAWLHPALLPAPERVWLLFCGNGSVALDFAGYFTSAALRHDSFVLFDYPAYGQCEGRPSPDRIRESIRALVPALAAKMGMAEDALQPKLRVFGHSLGSAAALMAMEEHGIKRGVLVAPFTRMIDLSRKVVGWPLCYLLHHRNDNVTALEHLKAMGGVRLQVFHGTADEVVPFAMGKGLSELFPEIVQFHPVPNVGHNDIIDLERTAILTALAEMR